MGSDSMKYFKVGTVRGKTYSSGHNYISGGVFLVSNEITDIVGNKPKQFFNLVLLFSFHCYLCKKACMKTAYGLNANATSILFIMSVMCFSCLLFLCTISVLNCLLPQ